MRRTQNSLMLEALADGQPRWNGDLRVDLFIGRPNSRAAELRELGYDVRCVHEKSPHGGLLYGYELVAVPAVPSALEVALPEPTQGLLDEIRRTRPASLAGPGDRDTPQAGPVAGGERSPMGQPRDLAGRDVKPAEAPEQPGLFDAPPGGGAAMRLRRDLERDYAAVAPFVCRVDAEVALELQAIERELDSLQEGFVDTDRYDQLVSRKRVLDDLVFGSRAA